MQSCLHNMRSIDHRRSHIDVARATHAMHHVPVITHQTPTTIDVLNITSCSSTNAMHQTTTTCCFVSTTHKQYSIDISTIK